MKKTIIPVLLISLAILSCTKQERVTRSAPFNNKAFELYKKGRKHFLMFTKKDASLASSYFDAAIKLKPDFALAMAANAESLSYYSFQLERNGLSSKNVIKKAYLMAKKAINLNKKLYQCKRALAWCFFASGLFRHATKYAKMSLNQNPDDAESAFLLWASTDSSNPGSPLLSKAVKSNLVIALINAGSLARRAGQYDLAVDYFKQVINLIPSHAHAYVNIGNVYVKKGEPEKAISYYEKALKMQENDSYIYFNFAAAYVGLRNFDKAKEYYNKALKINPNLIPAHKMLMKLYKKVYKNRKKYMFHKNRVAVIQKAIKLNFIEKVRMAKEVL